MDFANARFVERFEAGPVFIARRALAQLVQLNTDRHVLPVDLARKGEAGAADVEQLRSRNREAPLLGALSLENASEEQPEIEVRENDIAALLEPDRLGRHAQ